MSTLKALLIRMSRERFENLAGAVLLFLIVSVAYAPFTFGDRTIMSSSAETSSLYATGAAPNSTVRIPTYKGLDPGAAGWQTEPLVWLEHDLVVNEHVVPLWNPYSAYGQPLAADMLSQPFYPLTWVFVAHPSARSYNWFIVLRFYVGALFAFLYLRFFVRFWAAVAGGVAFAFTGYLLLYFNIAHISVECLIPALFWAFEWLVRRKSAASVVALALVIAAVVFGGMPESALLACGAAYLYFAVRVLSDTAERLQIGKAVGLAAGGTVLGLGISACLTLPFIEFLRLSTNQHDPASVGGAVVGHVSEGFSFTALGTYIAPLVQGAPWSNIFNGFSGFAGIRGFFGVSEFFLAIVATATALAELRSKERRAWSPALFFAFLASFLLLKRFGNPAVDWLGSLPGFNLINYPKYEEAVIGFCFAALAALGIEQIASRRTPPVVVWLAAFVPLAFLTALTAALKPKFLMLTAHTIYFTYSITLALLILAAMSAIGWYSTSSRFDAKRGLLGWICAGLVMTEALVSYFIPMWYVVNEEAPASLSAIAGAPYVDFLRDHLRENHDRFFGEDSILYPQWASAFQISDVRDLNAMYDNRYLPFVRAFLGGGPGDEAIDRFTGFAQTSFGTDLQRRFLALSSIEYIGMQRDLTGGHSLLGRALAAHPEDVAPVLHAGQFRLAGVTRDAIFMHAPRLRYPVPVEIPATARELTFGIGMDPGVWAVPSGVCGDGVNFSIELKDAVGRVFPLARHYIDPKHDPAARHWFDFTVPIGHWSGQDVTLLFSTEAGPSGSTCADWALWSNVNFDKGGTADPYSQFKLVFDKPDVRIYQYSGALPRLAIYTNTTLAASDADALRDITAATFDPTREAVITADSNTAREVSAQLGHVRSAVASGTLDTYESQFVRGAVDARVPSLVVLNDTAYPGWVASVDGRETPIVTTNYMFRGIVVPAGRHVVEFRYRPNSFRTGLLITFVSLLICAGLLVASSLTRRRRAPSERA